MHSPAKKCAASRHVIIYSLQLTKSNKIKVTQIMKCCFFSLGRNLKTFDFDV